MLNWASTCFIWLLENQKLCSIVNLSKELITVATKTCFKLSFLSKTVRLDHCGNKKCILPSWLNDWCLNGAVRWSTDDHCGVRLRFYTQRFFTQYARNKTWRKLKTFERQCMEIYDCSTNSYRLKKNTTPWSNRYIQV